MKIQLLTFGLGLMLLTGHNKATVDPQKDFIGDNVVFAEKQIGYQVKLIENSGTILNPRTVKCDKIQYINYKDWTSGFFPGTVWYMYELTGSERWKNLAIKYTENLDSAQYLTNHHDIGFIIESSYGNGLRLTNNEKYKAVIIEAAKSLSTRFRPSAGVIQSWNEDKGWQGKRGWMCPVIIDNMMNLRLLFDATRFSGDPTYAKIAISHADKTMENHFRPDNSCYHVVDYDKVKGGVRSKCTAQGYADESAWARGQAWALYGFMDCYRETKDPRYLKQVEKVYDFIVGNKNMPADLVPYWDFDAPNIPNEPRDASTAAIVASALYQLSTLGKPEYKAYADKIMNSLASPAYSAIVGTNGNFLLMHSVGSIPHGNEIDVPLNYADYYYLEALALKKRIENK